LAPGAVYRTLNNLRQIGRQVLGADLNRSESDLRGPAVPLKE